MTRFSGFAAAITILIASTAAHAVPISHFDFEGSGGLQLLFDIPTDPVPDFSNSSDFVIDNVSVLVNGAGPDVTNTIIFFYSALSGGFLTSGLSTDANTTGAQLFTGTSGAPSFTPGVYALAGDGGATGGTLTITAQDVPEPITFTLFGTGLLGLAAARRNRRG